MTGLRRLSARVRALFARRQLDRDLDDEIAVHLEEAAEELECSGHSREEARRQARLRFGGIAQAREAHREARSASGLEALARDVHDACRVIRRQPVFAAAVIGVLALGVGANTALVGVTHAVLVKPLPYAAPDEIYSVEIVVPERAVDFPSMPVSVLVFQRWREARAVFSAYGALSPWEVNLAGEGEPERLGGARVSAGFFSLLGIPMARGRTFDAAEEQPGRERVVVISDALWRRRYHGDPAVIGRTIRIADEPHEIVGVAAPSMLVPTRTALHPLVPFASRIDVWKPMTVTSGRLNQTSWDYGVFVRLPAGQSLETGREQLAGILNEMVQRDLPGMKTTAEIRLVPIRDVYAGRIKPRLLLVLAASALLLLTACTSLADLFMARIANRAHEFATRIALGASRTRVAGQVLAEVIVLAGLGGLAAALVADIGARALSVHGPVDVRVLAVGSPGPLLWMFALAASGIAGVACGMAPALQASRPGSLAALGASGRGMIGSRRAARRRQVLVGLQMAMATVLLSVSALLLHSFVRLSLADRGYDADGVLAVDLSLSGSRYGTAESRIAFYGELAERVRALPGVLSAGAISDLPALPSGSCGGRTIFREDDRPPFQNLMLTRPLARLRSVTPGYFAASGTPLRAGRVLDANELELVALVSESLARRLWPGDPIREIVGRRVRQAGDLNAPLIRIVGVVGDVRPGAMDDSPFMYYRPYAQWSLGLMSLVVRTAGDAESLVQPVRSAVRALDPNLPIAEIRTMRDVIRSTVGERRFQMMLTSLFAGVALLVGSIGLYGVVSYSVACRTREIGLRIALGAGRAALVRWVLVGGLAPVVAGLLVGLGVAITIAFALRSLLFEISPADPLSIGSVASVLLASACLACYLPARRAAAIDPMTALRQESA